MHDHDAECSSYIKGLIEKEENNYIKLFHEYISQKQGSGKHTDTRGVRNHSILHTSLNDG